jgi:hypothetical protein
MSWEYHVHGYPVINGGTTDMAVSSISTDVQENKLTYSTIQN